VKQVKEGKLKRPQVRNLKERVRKSLKKKLKQEMLMVRPQMLK